MQENPNPLEIASTLLLAIKNQIRSAYATKEYQSQPLVLTEEEVLLHLDAVNEAMKDLFPDFTSEEFNLPAVEQSSEEMPERQAVAKAFYELWLPTNKDKIERIKAGETSLISSTVEELRQLMPIKPDPRLIYEVIFNILTYSDEFATK